MFCLLWLRTCVALCRVCGKYIVWRNPLLGMDELLNSLLQLPFFHICELYWVWNACWWYDSHWIRLFMFIPDFVALAFFWKNKQTKNPFFFKQLGLFWFWVIWMYSSCRFFFFFKHCTVCTLLFGHAIITCSQVAMKWLLMKMLKGNSVSRSKKTWIELIRPHLINTNKGIN